MLVLLLSLTSLAVPTLGFRLPYIIGGTPVTDATKWPWQGSLEYHDRHNCGCVLISTTWAVTAAHCATYPVNTLKVRFGHIKRDTGGKLVALKAAITHEDWGDGAGSFPNDVAVIQFDALTLGDTINTISLSSTEQAGNTDCYITGWGYTESTYRSDELYRTLPEELHQANINVLTNDACKAKWEGRISAGHVCGGDSSNKRGGCNGDSGGPLVCKVSNKWELVGVTSWGLSTCRTTRPTVYTRISHFKSWIEGNTL